MEEIIEYIFYYNNKRIKTKLTGMSTFTSANYLIKYLV
ncbi:IS3 family transposase (plasmid) [Clostridium botulinum]|nr:IS3 family transposase [Clostridium botulinum D/C]QPW59369.1 IS3 family transposase [Clostridium botulinum]MCD3241242.1 IS3 family transposase [Clostridium botulinum D/C]MCD3268711.1 IS3 family transposase [Clostridium botulinum D/C]MCD3300844.1 IS3 family transposase [Clostridium botulinum D/C]